MRTDIVYKYIADDGTEFFDSDECIAYEMKLINNIGLKALNYDGKIINNLYDTEDIWYLILPNQESINHIIDILNYTGIYTEGIKDIGNYFYSSDYDRWFTLESFETYIKENSEYIKAKEMFDNLVNK